MFNKNILVVCFTMLILFSFTGCGADEVQVEPDVSAIISSINSSISFPEMVDVNIDRIDDYYEVDVSTIDDVHLIFAGSGASPEEILVIKFFEEEQAKNFEDKMNNRLKQISTLFNNYGSAQSAEDIQNCKMQVKNQYAFLAICEDSNQALQIFNDAFNS